MWRTAKSRKWTAATKTVLIPPTASSQNPFRNWKIDPKGTAATLFPFSVFYIVSGGSKPPPYIIDRTSLEFVGDGLDPPGSRILRFFNIFGEMKLSSKSVILSDQRESKDLGSIDDA